MVKGAQKQLPPVCNNKKHVMLTLIFDIGKTNKKYFIFDENFKVLYQNETVLPEIIDDDGFACDNLDMLTEWLLETFDKVKKEFDITHVNFSTYGASLVHLNKDNLPVTPLYNYLKPLPKDIEDKFLSKFNNKMDFSLKTSSPYLGMLNSGIQLFWLKYKKSKTYTKIDKSLHLPQYCSYLFSKNLKSEYTSIGCHTGLWNYKQNCYSNWIQAENIDTKFPEITDSGTIFKRNNINIGTGIHDSSAALIPYLKGSNNKFILISTGTWSISLNPFSKADLTENDLKNDCLNFMQTDGRPVKASRLFLGHEHQIQVRKLNKLFAKESAYFKKIKFDIDIFTKLRKNQSKAFFFRSWESIDNRNFAIENLVDYADAYHQLIIELVDRQIKSLNLAIGSNQEIDTIYIDGGFSKNELFCKILKVNLPNHRVYTTEIAGGSALGAAITLNSSAFNSEVFNRILKVKEVTV